MIRNRYCLENDDICRQPSIQLAQDLVGLRRTPQLCSQMGNLSGSMLGLLMTTPSVTPTTAPSARGLSFRASLALGRQRDHIVHNNQSIAQLGVPGRVTLP